MINFLKALYKSLNLIEVRGKENMDILLGCLVAIDRQIRSMESEGEEKEDG